MMMLWATIPIKITTAEGNCHWDEGVSMTLEERKDIPDKAERERLVWVEEGKRG